jgi:hypothetical protein
MIPKKYYGKLSQKNTAEQLKELKKSREAYKKGKYYTRKMMPSFVNIRSPFVKRFEKQYGIKITDLESIAKLVGIPIKAQEKIINKGMGAYYSSGSRPNQNPWSWAYARLASVILKGKAYDIDKHILDEYKVTIKNPVINCNKLTNNNVKKTKKCRRMRDGKVFDLPRRFPPSKCKKSKIRGYSMRSSCAPFV